MSGRVTKVKRERSSRIKKEPIDEKIVIKLEDENPLDIIKIESSSPSPSPSLSRSPSTDDSFPSTKLSNEAMKYNLDTLNNLLHTLKLSNELPKYEFTRKPKLKFRPPPCTVLNLNNINFNYSLNEQIELEDLYFLHYSLIFAKKTVVITGAGISVNSGIPDFRSSNGLFQGLSTKSTGSGKNLFDYNVFRNNDSIEKFEKMIEKLYHLSTISKPSPFHHMINDISKQNRLLRLYTQNIDCLDTELSNLKTKIPLMSTSDSPKSKSKSKSSLDKKSIPPTIQLHGSIKLMNCSKCNYISDLNYEYFENRKFGENKLIRSCPSCEEMNSIRQIAGKRLQNNGILRPRIVLYNEFHPDGEIIGSITENDLKNKPDCLIITGTTLKIPGVRRLVKEMAKVVHSNKGYVIWINIDEPSQSIIDYVEYFDLIIVGDCQLIPGLVKLFDYLNPFTQKSNKKDITIIKNELKKETVV